MYVEQSPLDPKTEPEIKKKKNKAGFIVFFANLFLMMVAFFVIKDHGENKSSQSLEDGLSKPDVSAGEKGVTENSAVLNDMENQVQDPAKTEADSAANNPQPADMISAGISKTAPQTSLPSSSAPSSSSSNNSSSKSSKKTKTS